MPSSSASTTAPTVGFPDLHSYLVARRAEDASLAQLTGELGTTIGVVRCLLTRPASTAPPGQPAAPASATDQRVTIRAAQLGFASRQTYLADRMTERAWSLARVAGELGVDPDTVRDRLDRHGLRHPKRTAR